MPWESVYAIVLYILPGYVVVATKDWLRVGRGTSHFERLAQSLVLSLVVYMPLLKWEKFRDKYGALCQAASKGPNVLQADHIDAIAILIAAAFLLGVLVSLLLRWKGLWYRFFCLVSGRTPYVRVWDEVLDRFQGASVCVELDSGEQYLGIADISSDDPSERDLLITNPYIIGEDGKPREFSADKVLISHDKARVFWFGGLPLKYSEPRRSECRVVRLVRGWWGRTERARDWLTQLPH